MRTAVLPIFSQHNLLMVPIARRIGFAIDISQRLRMAKIACFANWQMKRDRPSVCRPCRRHCKRCAEDKISYPASPIAVWFNQLPIAIVNISSNRRLNSVVGERKIAKRRQRMLPPIAIASALRQIARSG